MFLESIIAGVVAVTAEVPVDEAVKAMKAVHPPLQEEPTIERTAQWIVDAVARARYGL